MIIWTSRTSPTNYTYIKWSSWWTIEYCSQCDEWNFEGGQKSCTLFTIDLWWDLYILGKNQQSHYLYYIQLLKPVHTDEPFIHEFSPLFQHCYKDREYILVALSSRDASYITVRVRIVPLTREICCWLHNETARLSLFYLLAGLCVSLSPGGPGAVSLSLFLLLLLLYTITCWLDLVPLSAHNTQCWGCGDLFFESRRLSVQKPRLDSRLDDTTERERGRRRHTHPHWRHPGDPDFPPRNTRPHTSGHVQCRALLYTQHRDAVRICSPLSIGSLQLYTLYIIV